MSLSILVAPIPTSDVFVTNWPTDWVTTGASVAGILGLVIGVFALVQARRARIEADESIARERRTVFELEVLRDLLEPVVVQRESAASSPVVRALLGCLPTDDLPLVRLCQSVEDRNEFHHTQVSVRDELFQEVQRRRPEYDLSDAPNVDRVIMLALAEEIRSSMSKRVPPSRS